MDTVVNTILTNAEHDKRQKEDRVVLALLVDNDPGVLNKVSGLLSARGFNIESLTVSPTNLDAMSRMTVVIRDASEEKSAQAIKQLQDVVNVLAVVDYTGTNSLHVSGCSPCLVHPFSPAAFFFLFFFHWRKLELSILPTLHPLSLFPLPPCSYYPPLTEGVGDGQGGVHAPDG